MNRRFANVFLFLTIVIGFNSCGLFLQKSGIKNYTLETTIIEDNLNDFQYDFIYLSQLLDQGFPQIDSLFPIEERSIQRKAIMNRLADKKVTNKDFVMHSRSYLSNLHNEHTNIYLKSGYTHIYPFQIHISYDNWYLLNIDKRLDSLLIGKKIININGIETSEIENRLSNYTFAENRINQQYEIMKFGIFNKPSYLKEINVINHFSDTIKIVFEDNTIIKLASKRLDSGIELYKIHIPSHEITKRKKSTYSYSLHPTLGFGYLQYNKCNDKVDILEGIESYVKPWLQPLARAYVNMQFRKKKPSDRIAPYYNQAHPVFKDFLWEMVDSLNRNKINNLVIDLRNNPGGNLTLGIQLLYFLSNRNDLESFSSFAFTSEMYKTYFPLSYNELEEDYKNNIPDNVLIECSPNRKLFDNITDVNSPYFIPEDRPIFKGKVFVIANYRTGSAAAMLTTLIQDNNMGTIVGTSVGNNPTGATTWTPLKLPKTKARVSIASTYKERPDKTKSHIQIPHFWVEYTHADIFNGNDPYLEKVIELIKINTNY